LVVDAVQEETFAYIVYAGGSVTEYVCSRNVTRENQEEDVVDDNDLSLWKQNPAGFCSYTGTGNGDGTITAVF